MSWTTVLLLANQPEKTCSAPALSSAVASLAVGFSVGAVGLSGQLVSGASDTEKQQVIVVLCGFPELAVVVRPRVVVASGASIVSHDHKVSSLCLRVRFSVICDACKGRSRR